MFKPATWLMNRLTYSQKFGLISILFVIPLVYVIVTLNRFQQNQIAFTAREQEGVVYVTALRTILQDVVEQEFLIEQYLQGDANSEAVIKAKNDQLQANFAALRKVDDRYRQRFDNAAAHRHFIGVIRLMIQYVGDKSNLILDPDLDTYYLMDTTMLKIPEIQENLSTIGSISTRILNRQVNPQNDLTQLNLAKNLLLTNNEKLRYAFATISAETRDPTTRSKLQPSLDAANQSTQELSTMILDQILVPYAKNQAMQHLAVYVMPPSRAILTYGTRVSVN